MLGKRRRAFTLAELLIALTILGIIATFTIPKVLQSSASKQSESIAKESLAAVSQAYENYKYRYSPSASTHFGDLTPYLNYINVDTSTYLDTHAMGRGAYLSCDGSQEGGGGECLTLATGAKIYYNSNNTFGGTSSSDVIGFIIDPDGKVTGGYNPTDNPGVLCASLHFDGRLTVNEYGTSPASCNAPTWFSW
jgi:prepilin-type N-terminal cleavage/methylation domain-containing protein